VTVQKAIGIGILLLIVGVLVFAGWAIVGSVRSNGETDYCYIEMLSPPQMAPQWMLKAHRPWRDDRQIGVFLTLEEAMALCRLMKAGDFFGNVRNIIAGWEELMKWFRDNRLALNRRGVRVPIDI